MPGIFYAGQLVKACDFVPISGICLYDTPDGTTDVHTLGRLCHNDIALVIATTHGSTSVYVIGSRGSGWTFGAMLKQL